METEHLLYKYIYNTSCTQLSVKPNNPRLAHIQQIRETSLTLNLEVLCNEACYVYAALGSFRVVAVLEMEGCHTVQPRLTQLWGVSVRLGQSVVKVHKFLVVILVDLEAKETA